MGARLLRDWLSAPLTELEELNTRQLAINILHADSTLRSNLDQILTNAPDLARLVNRLTLGTIRTQRDSLAVPRPRKSPNNPRTDFRQPNQRTTVRTVRWNIIPRGS